MFCRGHVAGAPFIHMGGDVVHLVDIDHPSSFTEINGVRQYYPRSECHHGHYTPRRLYGVRKDSPEGKPICKACLRYWRNRATTMIGRAHAMMMVVRGW